MVQNVITDLVSAAKVDYSGIPGAEVGAGFVVVVVIMIIIIIVVFQFKIEYITKL